MLLFWSSGNLLQIKWSCLLKVIQVLLLIMNHVVTSFTDDWVALIGFHSEQGFFTL